MIKFNNKSYYNYNEIHQLLSIPYANSEPFCCFLDHYYFVDGFARLIPISESIEGPISQYATSGKWKPYNANRRDRDQIALLSEEKMFIRGFITIETVKIPKNTLMDPNIEINETFPLFKITPNSDCYVNGKLNTEDKSYYICSINEFKGAFLGYNKENKENTLADYSEEQTIEMLSSKKNRFDSEEFLYYYQLEDIKKQCKSSGKRIIEPSNLNKMIVFDNEINPIELEISVKEEKQLAKETEIKQETNINSNNNNSTKIIRRQSLTIFALTELLGEYSEYQNKSKNLNVSEVGRRVVNFLLDNPEYDFERETLKEGTFRNNHSEYKKSVSAKLKELIQDCMVEIENNFSKK